MVSGIEAVLEFRSREEWKQWAETYRYTVGPQIREYCLEWVRQNGLIDPYDGQRINGSELEINESNLRESIKAQGINSRGRAVFVAINELCKLDKRFDKPDLKVFAPEAITRFASRMRARYPYFLGTEYLPTDKRRRMYYPIQHQDLCDLKINDATFELVVTNDVFEHVPDLDQALTEIVRILVPYGRLIATFPFRIKEEETMVCATIERSQRISHIHPPEYHGNPVDPAGGSLVFQVPGWDILERVKQAGFGDACMTFYCSMRYGILASGINGVLVLNAKKKLKYGEKICNRRWHIRNTSIRALACLIGLPRSGTTVLTASVQAHSKVHAMYEPWNVASKREDVPIELDLDAFLSTFKVSTGDNQILLVKETSTKPSYIQSIDYLLKTLPSQFEKIFIWLIRNPFHVYLSEIEARRKWWSLEGSVSQQSFDNWSRKSLKSMKTLLDLLKSHKGILCSYETLAHDPCAIIKSLMEELGLHSEQSQLNYYVTIDKGKVAGDVNVACNPKPVSKEFLETRERELVEADPIIRSCTNYDSIIKVAEWCDQMREHGVVRYEDVSLQRLRNLIS